MQREDLLLLGEIKSDVKTLLQRSEDLNKRYEILDKRIDVLEHRWTRVYAYAAVIATMVTFASKYVIDKWLM